MRLFPAAIATAVALSLTLASCLSAPPPITDDMQPDALIQKAQNASDKDDRDLAIYYYQAILDRYSDRLAAVCEAEYEIGFIHYKEKRYDQAKAMFQQLLTRYKGEDAALLPPQFKILGEKILSKMLTEVK